MNIGRIISQFTGSSGSRGTRGTNRPAGRRSTGTRRGGTTGGLMGAVKGFMRGRR
jgi:hypothetical protein